MKIVAEKTTEKTLTTTLITDLHEVLSTLSDGQLTQPIVDELDQRGLIDYVTYKLCTHYLNNGYTLHCK